MYDPAVQDALLAKLGRWRRLPEGDLLDMLSPIDRLRYRSQAIEDLIRGGLVRANQVGDERIMEITAEGDAHLEGAS